jgi:hypothetical protein
MLQLRRRTAMTGPIKDEILRAAKILFEPGDVTELRILGRDSKVISGYFDNFEALADAATRANGAAGVYAMLNPAKPALLARAANRVRLIRYKEPLTSDHDVETRRWLLCDIDPVRPACISATDEEHKMALERAETIRADLTAEGWPDPVVIDSGNGAYLRYAIRLPNDEASTDLIRRVLEAAAFRFDDERVKVDTNVYNAARIVRLPGTWNRKGDDLPERPHRMAHLLSHPDCLTVVEPSLLAVLAATLPPRPRTEPNRKTKFDIDSWIIMHGLEVTGPKPWQDGRKWIFPICPWNTDHRNGSAFIVQFGNGALQAGCLHKSCQGKDWHSLRETFEPGWQQHSATQKGGGIADESCDWPEPEPLGGELPPVQAFDIELMPEALRPLVEDTAERMQVPLDYPAALAVLALGGMTNRRARIQPKAADTSWVVVPNQWGAIVAPPGFLKSPLITAMTHPLKKIETLWRIQYESELSEYGQQKEEAELRVAVWKESYKHAVKGGKDTPIRPDDSIAEPVCRRLITSDATAEKLHEILSDNPAGILVIRDEISGWLATLDKPGREGERGFFLSAWNGDTSYHMDRIGRGSIYVDSCCVSFLGGIQPARLRTYLSDTLQDGPLNDGLLQRFQVLVYPDAPPGWQYVDRPPNAAAATQAEQLCLKLANVDAQEPLFFRFDGGAQELFKAWLSELEAKVRSDVLHPGVASCQISQPDALAGFAIRISRWRHRGRITPTRPASRRFLRLPGISRSARVLDGYFAGEAGCRRSGPPSQGGLEA